MVVCPMVIFVFFRFCTDIVAFRYAYNNNIIHASILL